MPEGWPFSSKKLGRSCHLFELYLIWDNHNSQWCYAAALINSCHFWWFAILSYPLLAIVGYAGNSSPCGLWRSFSSFTIYTIFSVSTATTPTASNNIPTKSRKGLNFETSWGGNTFYDEITASEINSIIAVLRGL